MACTGQENHWSVKSIDFVEMNVFLNDLERFPSPLNPERQRERGTLGNRLDGGVCTAANDRFINHPPLSGVWEQFCFIINDRLRKASLLKEKITELLSCKVSTTM